MTGGDALRTVGRPLNRRLVEVTGWLRAQPRAARAAVGYVGTSTGAAAALRAATEPGTGIAAVVPPRRPPRSCPPRLAAVTALTLLIVGGHTRGAGPQPPGPAELRRLSGNRR